MKHRFATFAVLITLVGPFGGVRPMSADEDPAPQPGRSLLLSGAAHDASIPHSSVTLSPELAELREKVRAALAIYHRQPINTRDHNPWEVFHWIIGYGTEAEVLVGGPGGQPINAIGYLCFNGACRNGSLMIVERGLPAARKGPNFQGHLGQFLAVLAQAYVHPDYPIRVQGREFTVADFVAYEQRTCRSGTELTFKLIALAHYLPTDESWQNDLGERWTIDRLLREEIAAPINGAACGGTHRLMGISYGYKKRQQRGEPIIGESLRAQKYIRDYQQYTFRLQNPDGSFSTSWFKGPGAQADVGRRVQTSGHILEWLAYSLEDDELTDPRMVRGVEYLTDVLLNGRHRKWHVGHLGHAIHALVLYDARLFKPLDQPQDALAPVAESEPAEHPPLQSWRSRAHSLQIEQRAAAKANTSAGAAAASIEGREKTATDHGTGRARVERLPSAAARPELPLEGPALW